MSFIERSVFCLFRRSRCFVLTSRQLHSQKNFKIKLHKIGTTQQPNTVTEPYPEGTLFLHKVFPYRGIIIHSWETSVHETKVHSRLLKNFIHRDDEAETSPQETTETQSTRTRQQYYYKVIPDMRDAPHVNIESYFLQGDFVLHEDIIPFTSSELSKPIHHPAFGVLFVQDPADGTSYLLQNFRNPLSAGVPPTDVYRQTTENIRITVTPVCFQLGVYTSKWEYQHISNQHMWRYYIRIENLGTSTVTLRERVWKIADKDSNLVVCTGKGVVGKEPVLSKSSPAFQYTSHCTLESTSGWMWGWFTMERENGTKFECKIPKFQLKGEVVDDEIDTDPSGTGS